MRTVRLFILVIASACLILAGCTNDAPDAKASQFSVGVHDISFVPPAGWQQLDVDNGLFFRKETEIAQIYVQDAGPATIEKFQREIERAREVYRGGELAQANDILNALDLRPYFANITSWQAFSKTRNRARGFGDRKTKRDPGAIERAYADLLAQVSSLPDQDLETLALKALAEFEPMERRSISAQTTLMIGQRSALQIDTWDRLNHIQPTRYVVVLNQGNLLVVRTALGKFSEIEPAFEALVASLKL